MVISQQYLDYDAELSSIVTYGTANMARLEISADQIKAKTKNNNRMKNFNKVKFRNLYVAFFFIACTIQAQGQTQGPFVTTWEVADDGNPATTDDLSITIPINSDFTYAYTVDWGDGTIDTTTYMGDATYTYSAAGTYTVSISGDFPAIYFNNDAPEAGDNSLKIKTIKSWGTQRWLSLAGAFRGCQNLTTIEDDAGVPDLTMVTDMGEAFREATSFNSDLNSWDVSNVNDISQTFRGATNFNQDLSSWNVSNVADIGGTFAEAANFNQDISSWSVSNVTNMAGTFFGASSFSEDLSSWNISKVVDMRWTFNDASSFNSDLSSWDVSNVTSMLNTFNGASSFNGDLSSWNISNVTNIEWTFNGASSFKQDLSSWNVSNVTSMQSTFSGASSFNQDLSSWNVSKCTNMRNTFANASSFNQDLSNWDVPNVTDMVGTFFNATSFNQDLSSWNVSNVTLTAWMFSGATSFNSDLSTWNVSNVTDMNNKFSGATNFNSDLSSWDVSNVFYLTDMLTNATSFSSENYDALLTGWSSLPTLRTGVPFGAPPTTYCAGKAGRDILTGTYNWHISGDADGGCSVTPPPPTQMLYTGNGNSNDGIGLGGGSISFDDDGTTISCVFTKGSSDDSFDKVLVIYIDSKAGGFDTTNSTDITTSLKEAIAGDVVVSGTNLISRINFPSDFLADYAIAMSPVSGIESGALWELKDPVFGSYIYIDTVNLSPNDNVSSDSYTFDFDFADIGITSTDSFKFVAAVFDTSTGIRSDEAIGDGIASGSGGAATTIAFTGSRTYPNTWTGATNSDWATGGNWTFHDGNAPSSTHNILIPKTTNQPTAAAAVTVNKATISSGASLIANAAFSGNVTYNREIEHTSGNQAGWYLMASPVAGQTYDDAYITANDIAEGTGNNRGIATFNTLAGTWAYHQSGGTAGTFTSGQGYAIKKQTSTGAVAFTGTLNVDDAGVDVVLTNTGRRFNLLGNPYPSYLNSATFLNNEAAISDTQTLWVWNRTLSTNGGYEVKVAGDAFIIAPGQGFFVKANAGTIPAFNFSKANQSHNATDTFQKSTKTQIKLDISDGDIQNYCKIYYSPETTAGFDVGYEGELFSGAPNPFAIYTHLVSDSEGKHYQIQSLPYSDIENMVIPVGINAASGKEITITADATNFPAGVHLYLEDKLENSFTKLDENDAKYTVTLSDYLEGIGRFFLRASSSDLNNFSTSLENVSVYTSSKNNLRIVGIQDGDVKLRAYNILGAQIIDTSFKGNGKNDVAIPNLATGIYVIHLEMATGKVSRKVVVE